MNKQNQGDGEKVKTMHDADAEANADLYEREQGAGEFHSETPWIWALAGEITSKMEDMGAGMVFAKGHPDAEAAAMIAAAMNTLPPDSERNECCQGCIDKQSLIDNYEKTIANQLGGKAKIAELEREVERLKADVFDAGGERVAATEPPHYCSTCMWQAKNLRCTNPLGAACGQKRKYWEPKDVAQETAQEAAEERTRFLNETTEEDQ